jgi:hypothetical protein
MNANAVAGCSCLEMANLNFWPTGRAKWQHPRRFTSQGVPMFHSLISLRAICKHTQSPALNCAQQQSRSLTPLSLYPLISDENLTTAFSDPTYVTTKLVCSVKNEVLWDVTPWVAVRTGISEQRIASIIRVKRISELGTMLAVTSK